MHYVGVFDVNDNKDVNVSYAQIIQCIICQNSPILIVNPKLKQGND
jgi:hypothetical protein